MKKHYMIMSELHIWLMLSKQLKKKKNNHSNLGHVIGMHNQNFPYCQENERIAIKSLWYTNAAARFAK